MKYHFQLILVLTILVLSSGQNLSEILTNFAENYKQNQTNYQVQPQQTEKKRLSIFDQLIANQKNRQIIEQYFTDPLNKDIIYIINSKFKEQSEKEDNSNQSKQSTNENVSTKEETNNQQNNSPQQREENSQASQLLNKDSNIIDGNFSKSITEVPNGDSATKYLKRQSAQVKDDFSNSQEEQAKKEEPDRQEESEEKNKTDPEFSVVVELSSQPRENKGPEETNQNQESP